MLNLSVIIKRFQTLDIFPIQYFIVEGTTFINSVTKMKNLSYVVKTSLCTFKGSYSTRVMNLYIQRDEI